MKKITNLDAIKQNVSLPFLYLAIERTSMPPLVLHPYLETSVVYIGQGIKDVLQDTTVYQQWLEKMRSHILGTTDFRHLYMIVRKSYRLTFLKFAKPYMSLGDFSEYLADAWVTSENPNQDVNCSTQLLTSWFLECDKTKLMTNEEYEIWSNIPDTIEVYRGVAYQRNPDGLSWTTDLDRAKWFAHRFDSADQVGYVLSEKIEKENVLAYFDRRGETEYVINVKKFNDMKILDEK